MKITPNPAHPECFPNGKMYRRVLVHIFITTLTPTPLISNKTESPETVLHTYLKTNWPTGKLNATKMTELLKKCFKNIEPFGLSVKKEYCFLTPQDNPMYHANIRNWWENIQSVYNGTKSVKPILIDAAKNEDYFSHIRDLYKIHLMPLCKQEGSSYTVDSDHAIDILMCLFSLVGTNKQFRMTIESFKIQTDLRPFTISTLAPYFVIYVLDGKKSAQYALDTLAKKLPFKAMSPGFTYVALPYNIAVDPKLYPGLFYAQGDRNFKGPDTAWRDDVYDKSTGYALFNPKFVGAKSSKELMLTLPKKNIFGF